MNFIFIAGFFSCFEIMKSMYSFAHQKKIAYLYWLTEITRNGRFFRLAKVFMFLECRFQPKKVSLNTIWVFYIIICGSFIYECSFCDLDPILKNNLKASRCIAFVRVGKVLIVLIRFQLFSIPEMPFWKYLKNLCSSS